MGVLGKVLFAVIMTVGLVLPAAGAERAIIILDGSGSMWAQIDGKARITIARETLAEVLQTLPDDLELGFMSYGHREKGNCDDIEMLVEPATGTGPAIIAAADQISPKGKTPISEAVRRAAEALAYTEDKATVILITDGLETCQVDPCALASDLESKGVDFTAHVLGFGLSDEEGRQVACLAENTGGKYLSAQDGAGLVEALANTVRQVAAPPPEAQPAPEPAPPSQPTPEPAFNLKPTVSLSSGGPDLVDETYDIIWKWYKPAADGSKGEQVGTGYYSRFEDTLEPGDYILETTVGYAVASQPITITAGAVAAPHVVMDAFVLDLSPVAEEGGEPDGNASLQLSQDGEVLTTMYGHRAVVLPARPTEVDVSIGAATVSRSYDPKPGDMVKEDVVVGVGVVKVLAQYVPGSEVTDDIYMEVQEAEKALDGTRKRVGYGFGGNQDFTLAGGDYVLVYELDGTRGEIPISVTTGETAEVPLVLDAGVIVVTTPTDDYVEFRGPKPDIAGNSVRFDYGFGPEVMSTLKSGDYIVHVEKDGASSDTPITIVAGDRLELDASAAAKGGKKK